MQLFSIILIALSICGSSFAKKEVIIGGIFHGDDELTQKAFNVAVDKFNFYQQDYELKPHVFIISRTDSFKAQKFVCKLAEKGVAAIFGPSSIETSGIVSSMAEKLEIPHFLYHWKSKPLGTRGFSSPIMTLNLYPEAEALAKVLSDVLIDNTWKGYTIVYETEENLIRLKDILQIHQPMATFPIAVMKTTDFNSYGILLKKIKDKGVKYIVLDLPTDKIVQFLNESKHVGMLDDYNKYFITNLDAHTLNLPSLIDSAVNITLLRLVNVHDVGMDEAIRIWNQKYNEYEFTAQQMPLEAALVYDAVTFFGNSLKQFSPNPRNFQVSKKDCMNFKESSNDQQTGYSLLEFMRNKEFDGLTGKIEFNKANLTVSDKKAISKRGLRTEFVLDILQFYIGRYKSIAHVTTTQGVVYDRDEGDIEKQITEAIGNKTFQVAVRVEKPFLFYNEIDPNTNKSLHGNARFAGYIVGLFDAIEVNMKFKYEFYLVPDNKNGNYEPEKNDWNGLIGEILKGNADLAVADLTITYDRKKVVDFTNPFMSLGIGILYTKPEPKPKNLFSFLDPFTPSVWIYTGLAYLIISVLVFVLSRINNDDWESPHPCNQEPEEVESIWNILNCIWLMMGSIMGQGSDILPKGSSTRIVTGMWWFFALIMLASYTANLAAFLTSDRLQSSINGAEDLAKQNVIKYGAVKGGSTMKFFQDSNFTTYQRMWAAMESNGDSFMQTSNDDGVKRVEKGNYAFMMESVPMEYQTARNCKLMQVGGLLDSKGYGIALPIDSPYRKHFSKQILKLQESGKLNELKDTWWKAPKGEECPPIEKAHDDLDIGNVGGVFLVLIGGCIFAFFVACIEFIINVQKVAIEEKITHWNAFKSEIYFAFNFWIVTKPVRSQSSEIVSRKSSPPRSLKSRSRYGSETRSLKNKSTRSLNFDGGLHNATSKSLLNLH
ncbi:hypothetical protein PVAND_013518 [Polypedilum vanderplanki]|uniref:Uncharacterized protein n=1 Tax=Polypedilum vanderplanki TaxID=319348 RepID=A0A9J6CPP3_POLVA|nr:hypothetical protein PVAND_013518 [Polypedilum vanderplanki]